jgi:Ran GTPase-activating protein (RanGAP) involved in mRNA processing and transport
MPNLPADVIENVISRSLEDGDALAARAVNRNWNEAVPLPNVTILATDAFPSIVELPKLLAKTHSIHYEPANSADAASFLQALLHNTTITELQFGATGVEAKILLDLMDVLSHNSRVTSVTFEGLGVQGATAVASKLGSNQSIKTLKIEGNNIKEEGFNAICDALALNKTLESLDLSKNDLENVNTKHLADAMRANSSLRKLSLRECRIFEGYADFFASLADNHGLVELDYYFNDCEIAGLGKLLDALKTNTTLTHLGIGANGLGRAGADEEALATLTRLFTEHPIITHIDLESSDIEDDVAEAIGTSLAKNKTLKSLNFKLNTLTDDGIISFAKAIAVHPAIETLALQSSDGMMTDESLKSFLNALKTNKSLIYLGLEDCEDDSDYKEKIRHILEARPSGKLQVGDDD